jgi:hypothetical protein
VVIEFENKISNISVFIEFQNKILFFIFTQNKVSVFLLLKKVISVSFPKNASVVVFPKKITVFFSFLKKYQPGLHNISLERHKKRLSLFWKSSQKWYFPSIQNNITINV